MAKLFLIDYHLHTRVTVDGKMVESEACEQAIKMGIQEIAFTNHVMLNQPDYRMSKEDLLRHWENIQACQRRYPQLQIRLGLEMDFYPGREQEIADAISAYEAMIARRFDIILGAIHEMNGIFFSSKEQAPRLFDGRDLATVYNEYFDVSIAAVRSGFFDVLAHPDLVKKYTYEITPRLDFELYQPAVESFVEALLDSGVGIDVNMKGRTLKMGEQFPSLEFLKLYLERAKNTGRQSVLTLGSDAHAAEGVGLNIRQGALMLLQLGQQEICRFKERQHFPVDLEQDA